MNMWQEGTVLPIKDVRISSGMVHGTCPILVEGNEYIFRLDFFVVVAFLRFTKLKSVQACNSMLCFLLL